MKQRWQTGSGKEVGSQETEDRSRETRRQKTDVRGAGCEVRSPGCEVRVLRATFPRAGVAAPSARRPEARGRSIPVPRDGGGHATHG